MPQNFIKVVRLKTREERASFLLLYARVHGDKRQIEADKQRRHRDQVNERRRGKRRRKR